MPGARSESYAVSLPAPGSRKCLKCGRSFPSEGSHQRICRVCKRTRSPDDNEPDERLDSEASRARRERGLRRLMGLPKRQQGLARFFRGRGQSFEMCQWIDGEPRANDSCKCGLPVRPGSAYCDEHAARAHLHPPSAALKAEHRQAAWMLSSTRLFRTANHQPGERSRDGREPPKRKGGSRVRHFNSTGASQ
jgi:hypothetical protein